MATLTLPNGVTVAYTYDNDSRVNGITYTAGSTQLGNLTYSYDADGRRTATGGSLAAVNLPASASGDAFNADNGMTGFNGAALTYDANGNLTSDGTNTYTWDARHHLSAISGPTTASFVGACPPRRRRKAFGRRAAKTINGAVTQFVYDGLNPVAELDGAAPPNVTANLLTGLGLDERFTRTDAAGAMAFMTDALGSTVGLVNSAGGIDTSYTYQPFGATTVNGTSANPYQFTGRENDGTGLYFYRARYYSPAYQRFVSQDPIGFAGGDANLYAYVWNNPLGFLDALGLDPLTVQQLGNILFNETQSLSGSGISGARVDMGHVLLNGSYEDNPPAHASDMLPSNLDPEQQQTLNACHQAAQSALTQDNQGIDPTNGAEHYNNRVTNSNALNLNLNEAPTMILGPFDNSYNDYHYIDIYP